MHNLNKYWKWDGGYECPTCFKVGGIYLNTNRTQSDVNFDHYILVENVYGDDERSHKPNAITMRRVTVSDEGYIYAYYTTKVYISCQDGYFWYTEDTDRVSSQNELRDSDLAERIRQWSSHGVSKMTIDEDAVFNFIRNSNSCCYGEIYDYCKDIGMDDGQIDDAISNLKSKGKIDFVNQMDYVVKSTKDPIPFSQMVSTQRNKNNNIEKSDVNWDALVEKGQTVAKLIGEIKETVEGYYADEQNPTDHSIQSVLNILEEIDERNLIYNLNWNLVGARTDHRKRY